MKKIFKVQASNRKWHLPVVAGVCVGGPLFVGYLFGNMEAGKLGSLAGLSILYIQSNRLAERMMFLMTCCFGIMLSYTVGLFLSFNSFVAPLALGFLTFGVHFSLHKLALTRPPGNFFFIMLACTALCTPYNFDLIPEKIGFLAMGTMFTCGVGFIYSVLTLRGVQGVEAIYPQKKGVTNFVEALIFACFMFISLFVALNLKLDNPYWIPISCLAVMQGSSTQHVWLRGSQRVLGTLIGLGLTWLIVMSEPTPLAIVVGITLLQIIVEYWIVRNYAIATVFITILTIFLAEANGSFSIGTNDVFFSRLIDIIIGSCIGMVGGWLLYHKQVHQRMLIGFKKTRILKKKK